MGALSLGSLHTEGRDHRCVGKGGEDLEEDCRMLWLKNEARKSDMDGVEVGMRESGQYMVQVLRYICFLREA